MSKIHPKVVLVNLSSFFRFFGEDETRGEISGRKIRGVARFTGAIAAWKTCSSNDNGQQGRDTNITAIRANLFASSLCIRIHCSWELVDRPRIMQIQDDPRNKNDKGPALLSRFCFTVKERKKGRRDLKRRNVSHLQESLRRNSVCFQWNRSINHRVYEMVRDQSYFSD